MICELEQALFTSRRGPAVEGYHLIGASRGVSATLREKLSAWAPTHDALASHPHNGPNDGDESEPSAISWFTLEDPSSESWSVLALTRYEEGEYSARGGGRTTTRFLLAPSRRWLAFQCDPYRAINALAMHTQWLAWPAEGETELPVVPLLYHASPASRGDIAAQGTHVLGSKLAAAIADTLARGRNVVLTTSDDRDFVAWTLINLLPVPVRQRLSFSTGLEPSRQRPLQLHILSEAAVSRSTYRRGLDGETLSFAVPGVPPTEPLLPPDAAWGNRLYPLMTAGHWTDLAELVAHPVES